MAIFRPRFVFVFAPGFKKILNGYLDSKQFSQRVSSQAAAAYWTPACGNGRRCGKTHLQQQSLPLSPGPRDVALPAQAPLNRPGVPKTRPEHRP